MELPNVVNCRECLQEQVRQALKLRVVLEPNEEVGYTVTVPVLPGCISEGDTREEALRNIEEAIKLYLDPVDDDHTFPEDAEVTEVVV